MLCKLIRIGLAFPLAFALAGVPSAMTQESFPTRSVKIILPLPAGTALDVVARLIGEQLTGRWGQQVIIENRPGAGGALAARW